MQKAPASTVGDLAQAMMELVGGKSEVKIIGTRHGESFTNRWFPARKWPGRRIWRVFPDPADSRDLNYNKYFVEGEPEISQIDDYTSLAQRRLTVGQVKDVLMQLQLIRDAVPA